MKQRKEHKKPKLVSTVIILSPQEENETREEFKGNPSIQRPACKRLSKYNGLHFPQGLAYHPIRQVSLYPIRQEITLYICVSMCIFQNFVGMLITSFSIIRGDTDLKSQ